MYYLQVYGFYQRVNVEQSKGISLVNLSTQEPEKIQVANFQGIDANSSPIRFRACFEVNDPIDLLKEKYVMLNSATPRNAPMWFNCFNAGRIGEDLSRGSATAFLGSKNFEYGIDRYIVVYPDTLQCSDQFHIQSSCYQGMQSPSPWIGLHQYVPH